MTYLADEVIHVIASAGLWTITIWRCRRSLRSTGPDRSVWFTIFFLALAGTVDLWPVHRAIAEAVGHPAAGSMTTHVFVVFAGLSVIDMWRRVEGRTAGWPHVLGAWVAIGTTVVPLLSVAGPRAIASTNEFYDPAWPAPVHWIAYAAFMSWAFCISISVCRRYRLMSPPGPRRTGVTLIAVGCGGGLLYVAWKLSVLAGTGAGAGTELVAWDTSVDSLVIGPSLLLVAIGASYEAVTARLEASRSALAAWMALRRLHPLWAALVAVTPEVAFDPPRRRLLDVWSPRDVHFRLHRRVIEIRDGITTVAAYVPSTVPVAAERLAASSNVPVGQRDAAAEAAWVTVGRRLAARGAPQADQGVRARDAGVRIRDEVGWLLQVAGAEPFAAWAADRIERDQLRQAMSR